MVRATEPMNTDPSGTQGPGSYWFIWSAAADQWVHEQTFSIAGAVSHTLFRTPHQGIDPIIAH